MSSAGTGSSPSWTTKAYADNEIKTSNRSFNDMNDELDLLRAVINSSPELKKEYEALRIIQKLKGKQNGR